MPYRSSFGALAPVLVACATFACTPFKEDPPILGGHARVSTADAGGDDPGRDAGAGAGPPCDPGMPFGPPAPVPGFDTLTASAVSYLRLAPGSETAYFQAINVPGSAGYDDLYTATRPSPLAPFGDFAPIPGGDVNTPGEEYAPTVSADGRTLMFARGDPGGPSPVHLYLATRADTSTPFGDVVLAPGVNSTALLDTHPFLLSSDARVVYFDSSRGEDNTDLYRAAWTDASSASGGTFAAPVPIAEVNTTANEVGPVVSQDELTIYFGSDRRDGDGQGDFDIWMATRPSIGDPFSNAVDVRELNSPLLDVPSYLTQDGCTLYFTSSRGDGGQRLSVYVATRGQ